MNLETGCSYCQNLCKDLHGQYKCHKIPNLNILYAGACFAIRVGNEFVIIENCPGFEPFHSTTLATE
jgi:hypothetical protein